MATTAFGASKAHGVICVHPDCFQVMRTQKFKGHFSARHLGPGQHYETRHRDEFERALLDPDLLDLADDGPLKALMVASVVRIAHYLDVLAARIPPPGEANDEETENDGGDEKDSADDDDRAEDPDDEDGDGDGDSDGVVEESEADEEPAPHPSTRAQKRAAEKTGREPAAKTRKK